MKAGLITNGIRGAWGKLCLSTQESLNPLISESSLVWVWQAGFSPGFGVVLVLEILNIFVMKRLKNMVSVSQPQNVSLCKQAKTTHTLFRELSCFPLCSFSMLLSWMLEGWTQGHSQAISCGYSKDQFRSSPPPLNSSEISVVMGLRTQSCGTKSKCCCATGMDVPDEHLCNSKWDLWVSPIT